MNQVMEKTFELIDCLDQSDLIRDLERYRERVLANKELQELITKGNQIENEYERIDIKKKLYQNKDYCGYMNCYNELMYLVMELNQGYQKFTNKGSCCL